MTRPVDLLKLMIELSDNIPIIPATFEQWSAWIVENGKALLSVKENQQVGHAVLMMSQDELCHFLNQCADDPRNP